MKKRASNRRQDKRLKIDPSVRIPVHLFPVTPFIGQEITAQLINLSVDGIALRFQLPFESKLLKKELTLKIHFRLPGGPLRECTGRIKRFSDQGPAGAEVGVHFTKVPSEFKNFVREMIQDNDRCDRRIRAEAHPWCNPACSYFSLCRKPIRPSQHAIEHIETIEIAFQNAA